VVANWLHQHEPQRNVRRIEDLRYFLRMTMYAAMVRPIRFNTTIATKIVSSRMEASMVDMFGSVADLINGPMGVLDDQWFGI